MKTPIFVILFVLICSFSHSKDFSPSKSLKNITSKSGSSYEEYVYIDGVLWRLVYNEDGVLIFKEKIFD